MEWGYAACNVLCLVGAGEGSLEFSSEAAHALLRHALSVSRNLLGAFEATHQSLLRLDDKDIGA